VPPCIRCTIVYDFRSQHSKMSLSSNDGFTIITLSLMIQQVIAAAVSDDCAVVNSLRAHFGISRPSGLATSYGCCDDQEILCNGANVKAM
jgi:hypothetical protein